MVIEVRDAPPFYKNGYVLACETSRQGVLIDPGDEVEALLEVIERAGVEVGHILLTHAHVDHVSGVSRARAALGAPVLLHRDDLPLYEHVLDQASLFGLRVQAPPPVDRCYEPGASIVFGDCRVEVLHTPGHSPGGVSLLVGSGAAPARDVFVGDTLFAGSIGRTDLPGGDLDTLLASIRGVLFALDDEVTVHSGHGPATTIGRERRTNPFLNGAL